MCVVVQANALTARRRPVLQLRGHRPVPGPPAAEKPTGPSAILSVSHGFGNNHERTLGADCCVSDHGSSRSGTSGTEMDGSNKPNVKMSVAEAMLTYCLPSTR